MAGRNDNARTRSLQRGRNRRGQKESDVIVVALTAQILVCVLLLLAAGVVKKVDPTDYKIIKNHYSTMTTDEEQNRQAKEFLTRQGDGVASTFGGVVNFFVEKITGTSSQSHMDNAISVENPEEVEDGAASAFSYNYINPEAYLGGAGGMFPVDVDKGQLLQAPQGTTLAPVYLGGKIIAPVEGIITSSFSYREHPVTGNDDFHTGIDIAAEEGRAILAALPGEVVETGWSDIYGNYIIVQHATHLKTSYSHCSEIIAKEGMAIRQGERIAKVGQTGMVTGPHLHFSVIVDEVYTDPEWVLEQQIQLVE